MNRSVVQKVGIGALAVLASVTLAACGSSGPTAKPRSVPGPSPTPAECATGTRAFHVSTSSVNQTFCAALPANVALGPLVPSQHHHGVSVQGVDASKIHTYFDVAVYVAPSAHAAAALAKQFVAPPNPMHPVAPVSGHKAWYLQTTAALARRYGVPMPATVTGSADNLVVLDGWVVYGVWAAGSSPSANSAFIKSFFILGS